MSLYADLRWPAFAERYAGDLAAFARDVCDIELCKALAPALPYIEQPDCRLALHNAGQQAEQGLILAVVALWNLTTRAGSTTLISSPSARACEANLAIRPLLAHMMTGRYYWLARSIKHRASGWIAAGRRPGVIELRKVSPHAEDEPAMYGRMNTLWLVEGGDHLPSSYFEAIGEHLVRPDTGVVVACDWYVPQFIVRMVKHHGWHLADLDRSVAPSHRERQARHQRDLREFVELLAGKPLTSHQAAVLADLAQSTPLAQTAR